MASPRAKLQQTDYGYILEFKDELDISINSLESAERTQLKVKQYVDANMILVENIGDFQFMQDQHSFDGIEPINEMDLFDVERRDLTTVKELLKAPENASKVIPANTTYPNKRMQGSTREILRDGLHKLDQFDSLYNAVGILKSEPAKKPKRKPKPKAKK